MMVTGEALGRLAWQQGPVPPKNARTAEALPSINLLKIMLDYDPMTGVMTWKMGQRKGRRAGDCAKNGRRRILIGPFEKIAAARIAWAMYYGEWPAGIVDHKDRNPGNDRTTNLRDTNQTVNLMNRGLASNNTSGVKGVVWDKNRQKWFARISATGTTLNLGRYDDMQDAIAARRKAEAHYWGR